MTKPVLLLNQLSLSDEQFESIEHLAGLGYTLSQMAMYLEEDLWRFVKAAEAPDSKIKFHIDKGLLQTDFEINEKLQENAKSGNLTAVQLYREAQKKIELDTAKTRILYGE